VEIAVAERLIAASRIPGRTPLTRQQILGFWAAWAGWTLDGMGSFIYALVLSPALTELLPRSGIESSPHNVGFAGSVLFALFLVGWGLAFLWGPLADRFGRTRVMAATIVVYSVFTGVAALSQNVWQLATFRLLAGIGIGGEWALAGTYVAEAWPEDRRKMGAGYLQTGYYAGFFLASALDYTVGARYGWRAMFLCGLAPVVLAFLILRHVKEPERWQRAAPGSSVRRSGKDRPPVILSGANDLRGFVRYNGIRATAEILRSAQDDIFRISSELFGGESRLRRIFSRNYRRRTLVNSALLSVAIVGLWAGAVYEPTAVLLLAAKAGITGAHATRTVSVASAVLALGTILGCLLVPPLAERFGRKPTLGFYFLGMGATILLGFGWAFYLPHGLYPFISVLFFLGFFGGNFALFSLWLPEQYGTSVRATAFAFATSFGRFIGAGMNFLLGAMVRRLGTLGTPVAFTSVAFALGLLLLPFAEETRGRALPDG
jgi:MFS family permease